MSHLRTKAADDGDFETYFIDTNIQAINNSMAPTLTKSNPYGKNLRKVEQFLHPAFGSKSNPQYWIEWWMKKTKNQKKKNRMK